MDSSWHSCVEHRTKSFADIDIDEAAVLDDDGDDCDDDDDDCDNGDEPTMILARMPAAAMQAAWYLVRTRMSGVVNDSATAADEDERLWWTRPAAMIYLILVLRFAPRFY